MPPGPALFDNFIACGHVRPAGLCPQDGDYHTTRRSARCLFPNGRTGAARKMVDGPGRYGPEPGDGYGSDRKLQSGGRLGAVAGGPGSGGPGVGSVVARPEG